MLKVWGSSGLSCGCSRGSEAVVVAQRLAGLFKAYPGVLFLNSDAVRALSLVCRVTKKSSKILRKGYYVHYPKQAQNT